MIASMYDDVMKRKEKWIIISFLIENLYFFLLTHGIEVMFCV